MVTPPDKGDNYIWSDLHPLDTYKELHDSTGNPSLFSPLNLRLYYVADPHNEMMKLPHAT